MLRGHSALHGACDFEINVADRTMTVAKQRDGASGEVFGFELEGVEIGRDEDGDPVTSCVAVTADVTQRHAQGPKLTAADRVALTTIQNLVAQHGEPLPQGTGFPTSRRHVGVSATAVSAALRGSVFADRTAEAAQKASERVRTKLQSLGLIGVSGGFVWIPKTLDQPTGTDMSATCPQCRQVNPGPDNRRHRHIP